MTSTTQPSTPNFSLDPRIDSILGLAPIMTMACNGVDLSPLGQKLLERANRAAGAERANALMDVAIILQMKGDARLALAVQEQALELSQVFRLVSKRPPAIRLLIVMCPGAVGANTPLEFLLADSDIDVNFLYLSARNASAGPNSRTRHGVHCGRTVRSAVRDLAMARESFFLMASADSQPAAPNLSVVT